MATVTPNYNWPVPQSTDFVKDGATAIEALGDAIDATVFGLPSGSLTFISETTVGSAVSSVTVTGAFSATYDNYLIIFSKIDFSATNNVIMELNNATGSNYKYVLRGVTYANVANSQQSAGTSQGWTFAAGGIEADFSVQMHVYSPFLTEVTAYTCEFSGSAQTGTSGGVQNQAVSHTDFEIRSTATMTGGTIRVYGYQNS